RVHSSAPSSACARPDRPSGFSRPPVWVFKVPRARPEPFPNAAEIGRDIEFLTVRTSGFARRSSDPEPAQRNRCAVGSGVANPRRGAAPSRILRGRRGSEPGHMEPEGIPMVIPAPPKALVLGNRLALFPAPRGL